MNLSQDWCEALGSAGHESVHWSSIGTPDASDKKIMAYALENSLVIFTQDLDFSELLAISGRSGPSVLQLRGDNRLSDTSLALVTRALRDFEPEISQGALITLSVKGSRARVLPL